MKNVIANKSTYANGSVTLKLNMLHRDLEATYSSGTDSSKTNLTLRELLKISATDVADSKWAIKKHAYYTHSGVRTFARSKYADGSLHLTDFIPLDEVDGNDFLEWAGGSLKKALLKYNKLYDQIVTSDAISNVSVKDTWFVKYIKSNYPLDQVYNENSDFSSLAVLITGIKDLTTTLVDDDDEDIYSSADYSYTVTSNMTTHNYTSNCDGDISQNASLTPVRGNESAHGLMTPKSNLDADENYKYTKSTTNVIPIYIWGISHKSAAFSTSGFNSESEWYNINDLPDNTLVGLYLKYYGCITYNVEPTITLNAYQSVHFYTGTLSYKTNRDANGNSSTYSVSNAYRESASWSGWSAIDASSDSFNGIADAAYSDLYSLVKDKIDLNTKISSRLNRRKFALGTGGKTYYSEGSSIPTKKSDLKNDDTTETKSSKLYAIHSYYDNNKVTYKLSKYTISYNQYDEICQVVCSDSVTYGPIFIANGDYAYIGPEFINANYTLKSIKIASTDI